ncbi:MAG: hypothetical protein AB7R89_17625 [Dehalococcoidia bacterium]
MTQISNQQQEAVRERAAAKFQAFYNGLTEDERHVFESDTRRLLASQDMDTQGYRIREERVVVPKPRPTGSGAFPFPSIWLDTIYDPDDGSTSPLNPPG